MLPQLIDQAPSQQATVVVPRESFCAQVADMEAVLAALNQTLTTVAQVSV